MKLLYHTLLDAFQTARPNVVAMTPQQRQAHLLEIVSITCSKLRGRIAINSESLVAGFVASHDFGVDAIIDDITVMIHRTADFDNEILRSEHDEGFDRKYGTTTAMIADQIELPDEITPDRLQYSARYAPSPVPVIRSGLKHLETLDVPFHQSRFIDVGSGLGRNLLIASEFGFEEIVGIEISRFLCEKATINVQLYNKVAPIACRATIHCIDALMYEIPKGNNVFYFWEPFEGDMMGRFINNVETSIRKGSRATLVFSGRQFVEITKSGLLTKKGEKSTDNSAYTLNFYQSL
jgi:SAM-dependent methyltransferase